MQGMDPLDLLFERLVRAVREKRPEFLIRPFEVAELMELVPYRALRGEGAVETNDDYAHALTRLLVHIGAVMENARDRLVGDTSQLCNVRHHCHFAPPLCWLRDSGLRDLIVLDTFHVNVHNNYLWG